MPERIGRFELLFPIGTGGMGTVYLARAELLPGVMRNVAVKLMHSELRANPEVAPTLMAEAKLAASIQHPNVVAVLEAGDSPHGVFLVMDHVEGDTLAGLIRAARKLDEPVPLRIAARIMRDALTGLHAAHELKDDDGRTLELVHRDFSPHNILVGANGISLLTDFGIAKALSHNNATATGIVKGKVGYMAPEQARGERVDRRSDVWAAGVVAWELFTSHRLFRASNDAATLLQIISGKRPPLVSSQRPDVPEGIDEAVAAALQPKPTSRLASALAFRKQLEDALALHGGVADEDEVADYVMDLVGHRIEQTKSRAAHVLELRAQIADLSVDAPTSTRSDTLGTPPASSDFHEPSSTRLTAVSGARAQSRKNRWPWAVAALLMAGAAVLFFRDTRTVASGEPLPPPTQSVAPAPTASADVAPAPARLTFRANAPIAQLQVDDRTIVLPQATEQLEVPFSGDAPKKVVAITGDGRKVEVALTADQREVVLDFPPQVTPPSLPVRRPPPPPATDGLADSPYGSK